MVMSARLFAILPRRGPHAVILRRGPSRHVALIAWNTHHDTFEVGQWFKGRIYEHRCDLSPKGEWFIYFAASWKKRHAPGSWTAVSRPPWLSALALWPKGDAWGGGGLFHDDKTILLNHRDGGSEPSPEMVLAKGALPRGVSVRPLGEGSGWGEDDPIYSMRMARDGWRLVEQGHERQHAEGASPFWSYDPAHRTARTSPRARGVELIRSLLGVHEKNGAWYVLEHAVHHVTSGRIHGLGRSDWADWDRNGDLLLARGGTLFRWRHKLLLEGKGEPVSIADFSSLAFEEKIAPPNAHRWRG
jgi:hypothetical protein